ARRLPSALKATLEAPEDELTASVRSSWPVSAFQTLTVLSSPVLARRLPSGLKTTLWTRSVWPLRVRISSPVPASHTFTSPGLLDSPPALASRLPSGLKTTLKTSPPGPLRVKGSLPEVLSHTFTVPDQPPAATRLPSGLKATWLT